MSKDKYLEPKTMTYPGIVAKVYSSVLSDVERKARMERIAKSAQRLLKATKSN